MPTSEKPSRRIVIKIPETEQEFRSMWELNHEVFACEFAQHPRTADGLLIDKFHGKNIYRIAWDGERVLGMISAHWQPPFSAVQKFGEALEKQLLPGKTGEIRLFALRKEIRGGVSAIKLGVSIMKELMAQGMELVVISAISHQVELYRHIGFAVQGLPVTENGIDFYPMLGNLKEMTTHHSSPYGRFAKQPGPSRENRCESMAAPKTDVQCCDGKENDRCGK